MEIRTLHQQTITDAEADELADLRSRVDPRRLRSDPPISRQLAVNELRPSVATFAVDYYGLFDGSRLLGFAETFGAVNAENTDVSEIGIWVDPDHLDQGHHQTLFDHVDQIERGRGRVRYWGWGDIADDATRTFWEDDRGYSLAYDERISRCALAEVDADMIGQWIARAGERAAGYKLLRAEIPFDDQQIAYFAQGLEAMNDAPVDDLVLEVDSFDVNRAREIESLHIASKCNYRAIFAIETATGDFAGFTTLRIPDAEPALSHQGDTVTVDAHRNRGIGRWLKADMWQWLRDERPDVVFLDTGNAESNRAMLAINEAMGFRDILHHGVWHKTAD